MRSWFIGLILTLCAACALAQSPMGGITGATNPVHVNGFGNTTGSCGGVGTCVVNVSMTGYVNPNWIVAVCTGNQNYACVITSSSGTVTNRTSFADATNAFRTTVATITGATTGTVTITCTGTTMFRTSCIADQYSNISGFDIASSTTWAGGTVSTSVTATAITTTVNGDLCEGIAVDEAANGTIPSATAPFAYTTTNDGVFPVVSSYYVQGTAGSISSAWTGFNAIAVPVAATVCLI